jgi:hypothetical protein
MRMKDKLKSNSQMTKHDLDKLLQLVRQEAKALKSATGARAAQVLADFEQKIATKYSIDHKPGWAKLFGQANEIIQKLNAQIVADIEAQGIPAIYAPGAGIGWLDRGENLLAERRAELRRVAESQAEADQKTAQTKVDLWSVKEQRELLAHGLESEQARNFLERRPSLETLMPALRLADIEKDLEKEKQVRSDYHELPWRLRH